jgi:hypothetical protein
VNSRIEHLIGESLAKRQAQRVVSARDLLETLRSRDLEATAAQVSSNACLPYHRVQDGEVVAGVYRQRLERASGRFAMIDEGLGFSLVPWSPSLERHLGRQVSGSFGPAGSNGPSDAIAAEAPIDKRTGPGAELDRIAIIGLSSRLA